MVGIIDYKAGNAPSVLHAVQRLGYKASLITSGQQLLAAAQIILPGVGSARATMASLDELGLLPVLDLAVRHNKMPFLGICVGMQILFDYSEEEHTDCLGWLKGRVVRFDPTVVRVPQMGWNQVHFIKPSPCQPQDDYYYFVNSYYARPENVNDIWGTADYGGSFTAAVCRDNIYATQFHVEKSGEAGLSLINAFLQLGREV